MSLNTLSRPNELIAADACHGTNGVRAGDADRSLQDAEIERVGLTERKRLSVRRVQPANVSGMSVASGVTTASGVTSNITPVTASSTPNPIAARVNLPGAAQRGPGATPSTFASAAVPLKRLTAGRKELSILHAGCTYLLRVTKSNKLILTKA